MVVVRHLQEAARCWTLVLELPLGGMFFLVYSDSFYFKLLVAQLRTGVDPSCQSLYCFGSRHHRRTASVGYNLHRGSYRKLDALGWICKGLESCGR